MFCSALCNKATLSGHSARSQVSDLHPLHVIWYFSYMDLLYLIFVEPLRLTDKSKIPLNLNVIKPCFFKLKSFLEFKEFKGGF
jgi:hypothetical protein